MKKEKSTSTIKHTASLPSEEDSDKYRDSDRIQEAQRIPLTDKQKGVCITAALKKDRSYPDLTEVLAVENAKLKKRAQEAEGELSILRGIETNRVKEAQARSEQLQNELDRVKKENNNLYNQICELKQNLEN